MCGINGFNFSDEKLVKAMNNRIKHRGPDDSGIEEIDDITFGHVRLSIIDLSDKGHQPMFYSKIKGACSSKFNKKQIKDSNLSIVFNGEIYNYLEIREELIENGYKFSTQSDTEVILASYLEWGESCVEKFNGMWAFAIYDMKRKQIFCSRDRLGVKPFYYYFKEGKFIFSSELKGILEHKDLEINSKDNLNLDALQLYFSLGFVPSPMSIFNDVYKLNSAHNLIFDLKKNEIREIYQYYKCPKFKANDDKKKLLKKTNELLYDATKLRMRSDVEVGAFLSGGLDSTTVVSVMRKYTKLNKLHTFSIGFKSKDLDETPYIKIAKNAFKTKHHHSYFFERDFKRLLNQFAFMYDEPFGDYSSFSALYVSALAKKNATVVLSGDGGDEIFGGYNVHILGKKFDLLRKIPWIFRSVGAKIPAKKNLNDFMSLYTLKEACKMSGVPKHSFYSKSLEEDRYKPKVFIKWTEEKLKDSLKLANGDFSEGLRVYDLLYNTLSDNFLVKVDRASMANQVEVRSPFLDYRFVELSQRIPNKFKVNLRRGKILMRELIKKLVPKKIIDRGKQGFTPPVEKWILSKDYESDLNKGLRVLEKIDDELFSYFNNKVFKENNRVYVNDKIRLFLFAKWYERWVR